MTRLISVPFRFSVNPGIDANQSSQVIQNGILIDQILVIFPINTQSLMYYQFFVDAVPATNPTGTPGGRDIFDETVTTGQLTGDGIAYTLSVQRKFTKNDAYIKMYANNATSITQIAAGAVEVLVSI